MSLENKSLVNYVWVSDVPLKPDLTDPYTQLCGVPLHYIDRALQNAEKYPNAKFNLWFDFDFLDETTRLFIDSTIYFSGFKNITIRNLRDIDDYKNIALFDKEAQYEHPSGYFGKQPYCKYARADLARVVVLKHVTDAYPDHAVFYCDFDVEDVSLNNLDIAQKIEEHGMVFGNTEDDAIENGYMAFIRDNLSEDVYFSCGTLQLLVQNTLHATMQNNNGWRPLKETVSQRSSCLDEVTVDGLLHERGYKIPKPEYLTHYRIC
jgi:hypothetical protein